MWCEVIHYFWTIFHGIIQCEQLFQANMKYYLGVCILINVLYLFPGNVCFQDIKGVVPEEYLLVIEPYFNNMTFQGKVSITISIMSATTQIILRAEHIEHKEIKLKSSDASKTSEISVGFMENNGSWLLFTVEELLGNYILNISFAGQLSNTKEQEGLFYNVYIDNETEKMYAASESWTGNTSRLFPNFDYPLSKTPFTAYIARDPLCFTLSSMQWQETFLKEDAIEDKVWDKYYNPNITTSQVGFIIHELSNVTTTNFTVLAKSEALDQTSLALSLLPAVADLVQERFPDQIITKLEIVALPDGGPQMIFYPGLVFCSEDQILFKQRVSNSKSCQQIEESVVRILVKQLLMKLETEEAGFYDGLATYMEHQLLSQMDSTRKISKALYMDVLDEEISDFNQDSTHIFHKKVAGALRMIVDGFSTEETVMKASSYLLNESKPVTSDHFFSIIDHLVKESNNLPSNYSYITVMQAWLSQTGWPVVTVTMNDSAISITQMSSTESNATWPIPLSFKCDRDFVSNFSHSYQMWLTETFRKVPLEGLCKWVLFHTESGLYRVNYDSSGWHMLANQLITNHSIIPAGARSRLVDDLFHLAERGLVSYTEVFRLTQYLANETDYLPWNTAASNFEKLIKLFYGTQLALNIQEYVKSLYLPYFEEVYRIPPLNVPRIKQLASSDALFWGCHWGLESCRLFTTQLFKQWQSVSIRFPPDYKQAALCTGVREYPEVFMEVFDAFTQSLVEGDRLVLLRALACTKSPAHLNFLLELVFLDENQTMIGHQNKLPLIQYLVEFPDNLGTVIGFLGKNYDTAATVVGLKVMSSVWTAIERNIYAQEEIILIQNMSANSSLPVSLRETLSSILVKVGITWKKSSELAPLVSMGLSQHWTVSSSCVRSHPCFYVSSSLEITLLLQVGLLYKFYVFFFC